MSPNRGDVALLLALSLTWAAGYLFVSAADHGIPPLTATCLMSAIAAAVLLPTVALLGHPLRPTLRRRPWVPLVMGLTAVALPNLAIVAAEHSVEADETSVLGTVVPILTVVLTALAHRAPPSVSKLAGVVTATVGLVIFVGWDALTDGGAEARGALLLLGGAACFAVNGVFLARQTRDLNGPALSAWAMTFAVPPLAAAAFLLENPLAIDPGPEALTALIANGTLTLGVAYLFYYSLVARAGALFASFYAYLVPPLGVLLVALTTQTLPMLRHLVGTAVVLLGLFLLNRR